MSLTTSNLSASLGSRLHKYGDPNAFFVDDELRKLVEMLQGAVVISFQERPEGTKRAFREDLYKKVASADGIAGRMPYGIQTRNVELPSWTRFELNSLLKFLNVSEATFNTVFRRSLVVHFRSQFMDRKFLEATMGMSEAAQTGLCPRESEAKARIISGPAIAASLRIQLGFEMTHSLQACKDLLDDYVLRGGDHGITTRYTRHACGLPPLPEAPNTDTMESVAEPDVQHAHKSMLLLGTQGGDPVTVDEQIYRAMDIAALR